jgi:branched-chain amino acid aminotransferase
MTLAQDLGYEVREEAIARDALYIADEFFMTGTATEIVPVKTVDGLPVGTVSRGPITKALQNAFFGIFDGTTEDKWGWLEPVA